MYFGPHLSIAKGFTPAVSQALEIGANTFQFFTRNPRGGKAKELDPEDFARARQLMDAHAFGPLLAHAPYTLNLASASADTVAFGREVFADDLMRLRQMPGNFYNFHPGSHVGQGLEVGIRKIADALNELLTGDETVHVLLETMAGKGTEVGSSFEELREIMDRTTLGDRLGVCLDTCHVYSAGYDVVNDLDGVLTAFDKTLGLDRLRAIHLNDSMKPFGSRLDRHEKLGLGTLGQEAIRRIVTHPVLRLRPFYLETPNEMPGYAEELRWLRDVMEEGR